MYNLIRPAPEILLVCFVNSSSKDILFTVYNMVIIGRGGQRIRELEEKSKAKIKVLIFINPFDNVQVMEEVGK